MSLIHIRVNRVQISISSNDDVSISRTSTRSSGWSNMVKFKRGPRCYAILGAFALCMLILYLGDFSYVFAILNKKVIIRRLVLIILGLKVFIKQYECVRHLNFVSTIHVSLDKRRVIYSNQQT